MQAYLPLTSATGNKFFLERETHNIGNRKFRCWDIFSTVLVSENRHFLVKNEKNLVGRDMSASFMDK